MSTNPHDVALFAAVSAAQRSLSTVRDEVDYVIRNGGGLSQHDQELLVIARTRVDAADAPLQRLLDRHPTERPASPFVAVGLVEVEA